MVTKTITSDYEIFGRDNYNYVHRIRGTIAQVLTELGTAGIKPNDVDSYTESAGNAVCVYKRGQ